MQVWKPTILLAAALGFFVWKEMSKKPVEPNYPESWQIPRTLKTTNGQVFQNATIRSLAKDGVVINHGSNTIKIPSGMMDAEAMAIIVKTAPATGSWNPRESPFVIDPNTLRPPQRFQRYGGPTEGGTYQGEASPGNSRPHRQ